MSGLHRSAKVLGPTDGKLGDLGSLGERYGIEFDVDSIPGLLERHGLVFGPD